MLVVVVVGVSAGLLSRSVGAKSRLPAAKGVEPLGSAEWPAVAAQLAKNIARDSFAHRYDRVWGYLSPVYQRAVSESYWVGCQGSHPAAPRTVSITKVSVANATELPVDLSLLGRQNVQEVELVVEYRIPVVAGLQLASLETFWLKQGSVWRAVWMIDEYRAYKAGRCYLSPAGPPLY